ncbi:MAG TPA: hypothetical protein VFB62_17365 [Polyangiaceae bacterium]|jgi:hypothetical protein|nr:hypothetical protein [Polyangiaceae bacterium]
MARFGTNLKLTVASNHRPRVRSVFTDVLSASVSHTTDELEIYTLEDGGNVGVYYVDEAQALDPEEQPKGAWLEFLVADPRDTAKQLLAAGVARVDHPDKKHDYFQLPGGPVFRLA